LGRDETESEAKFISETGSKYMTWRKMLAKKQLQELTTWKKSLYMVTKKWPLWQSILAKLCLLYVQ